MDDLFFTGRLSYSMVKKQPAGRMDCREPTGAERKQDLSMLRGRDKPVALKFY